MPCLGIVLPFSAVFLSKDQTATRPFSTGSHFPCESPSIRTQVCRKFVLASVTLSLLFSAHLFAQSSFGFVNNITVVPVPGVGHDYLHDLNEIVNPANGSLSVRIEAPRPKERGPNYPFYAFMYDSTQQFAVVYQLQSNSPYQCGPDTDPSDGDGGDAPPASNVRHSARAISL